MFKDLQDRAAVKMSGGLCLCDEACFRERSMGLKWVGKHS